MKVSNKILILAAVLVFLFIAGFALLTDSLNIQTEVTVGDSVFTIPEGYHKGLTNSNGDISLTNNRDSIFIKEYNKSITQCVNSYQNYKKARNYDINVEKFTVDNISGYKSSISNETNIHYWFAYNKKTYCIYTWDDNNIDDIAIELMKTVKSK